MRLTTRVRLYFSHLCEHEFEHPFQDCLNRLCFCGNDIETSHYILYCPTDRNERINLLDKTKTIDFSISELNEVMTGILLFGGNSLSASSNTLILNSTSDYIKSTKRFDDSILITGNNEKAQFSSSISFLFFYFWNDLVYFSLHVLV